MLLYIWDCESFNGIPGGVWFLKMDILNRWGTKFFWKSPKKVTFYIYIYLILGEKNHLIFKTFYYFIEMNKQKLCEKCFGKENILLYFCCGCGGINYTQSIDIKARM